LKIEKCSLSWIKIGGQLNAMWTSDILPKRWCRNS
jgi:hypothetical protein